MPFHKFFQSLGLLGRSESTISPNSYKPGQKTKLMTLPREIRYQIFSHLAEPEVYRTQDGEITIDWRRCCLSNLPRQIKDEAISAYYGCRQLVIHLLDFEPRSLQGSNWDGKLEYRWPSEIHFHDQHNDLSFRLVPSFLAYTKANTFSPGYTSEFTISQCPFHLFNEIEIRIPPPRSGDIGQLIMNWSRLRCIGQLLADQTGWMAWDTASPILVSNLLPPIRVVFLENASTQRSWFDLSKNLTRSIPLPMKMCLGNEKEHSSDLLILLRALAPIRGSRRLIVEPALPESVRDLRFSVTWLSSPRAQKYKYGEYIDSRWNDLSSFYWLTRCEILFHRILHQLDTPIAPFLRLEQMASAAHDVYLRLAEHAREFEKTSQICERTWRLLLAIHQCSIDLSPWCECGLCGCLEEAEMSRRFPGWSCIYGRGGRDLMYCREGYAAKDYLSNYKAWRNEFHKVKLRLEDANGFSFGPFFGSGKLLPMENLPSSDLVILDDAIGFGLDMNLASTTTSDLFRVVDSGCPCYNPKKGTWRCQEAWIRRWSEGIVHDVETLQSGNGMHCHPRLWQYSRSRVKEIYQTISPLRSGKRA